MRYILASLIGVVCGIAIAQGILLISTNVPQDEYVTTFALLQFEGIVQKHDPAQRTFIIETRNEYSTPTPMRFTYDANTHWMRATFQAQDETLTGIDYTDATNDDVLKHGEHVRVVRDDTRHNALHAIQVMLLYTP